MYHGTIKMQTLGGSAQDTDGAGDCSPRNRPVMYSRYWLQAERKVIRPEYAEVP